MEGEEATWSKGVRLRKEIEYIGIAQRSVAKGYPRAKGGGKEAYRSSLVLKRVPSPMMEPGTPP